MTPTPRPIRSPEFIRKLATLWIALGAIPLPIALTIVLVMSSSYSKIEREVRIDQELFDPATQSAHRAAEAVLQMQSPPIRSDTYLWSIVSREINSLERLQLERGQPWLAGAIRRILFRRAQADLAIAAEGVRSERAVEQLSLLFGAFEQLLSLLEVEDRSGHERADLLREQTRTYERIALGVGLAVTLGFLGFGFAAARQVVRRSDANERERERLRVAINEQREAAVHSDRLRLIGEMAAGVAHDLHQPITAIRGTAELVTIAMDLGAGLPEDRLRRDMATVVSLADRAANIVNHIRRFSYRGGSEALKPIERLDLSQLVPECFHLVRARSDVTVTVDLVAPEPVFAKARRFDLEEVILNVMSNARYATTAAGAASGAPPSPIDVRIFRQAGEAVIEITDRGTGIPPEILDRVFDPFFTTKPPSEGTGLGLSTSRRLLEQMEGRLGISSRPGHGTTARIYLPADDEGVSA